ncbi:MAG: hypothetical protein RR942_01355 [Romboutsia sp.]
MLKLMLGIFLFVILIASTVFTVYLCILIIEMILEKYLAIQENLKEIKLLKGESK